jgi:hypothetical protein
MRSMTLSAVMLAGAVALAPTASAQRAVGWNDDVWTWSDRVSRGDWFRFIARSGTITVTEGSGDRVEVRAEKITRRGQVSDVGFMVVPGRDGVTICAVYEEDDECDADGIHGDNRGSNRQRATLQVTVQLPRGVKVQAQSGNGDVSVRDASDQVVAASGNGKVRVSGSGGEVRASSGNGEVTVEGAHGPVDASTGNGDVTIATSTGPVTAHSGNGNLVISMDALQGRESMDFTTGNGRISLTVPDDFAADLEASTGNGSVSSDFPITMTGKISPSHVRGTIGRGGPRLRMTSGNGRIELLRGDAGRRGNGDGQRGE